MQTKNLVVVVLAASLAAACVTGQTKVSRSEFEDIPVPRGLSFVESRATVIESPSVKAARLYYRGRIEINSLGLAMRTTLEANGWRSVSNTTNGSHGITQVFEKNANSLQVRLWEGWWFTYVELTASRALQTAK
ncbi:MAG: hypothetical protein ACREJV_05905 [Candidatus Rokuibacteriota bacterium]